MPTFDNASLILTDLSPAQDPLTVVTLNASQTFSVAPANPVAGDGGPLPLGSRPFSIVGACTTAPPPPGRKRGDLHFDKNQLGAWHDVFHRNCPVILTMLLQDQSTARLTVNLSCALQVHPQTHLSLFKKHVAPKVMAVLQFAGDLVTLRMFRRAKEDDDMEHAVHTDGR